MKLAERMNQALKEVGIEDGYPITATAEELRTVAVAAMQPVIYEMLEKKLNGLDPKKEYFLFVAPGDEDALARVRLKNKTLVHIIPTPDARMLTRDELKELLNQ